MKIILFLLANLFLVNSLPLTNKIGTTLLRNKIDSVDILDQETDYNKFDSVDIDEETDDIDDSILVPEKETELNSDNVPEIKELINNTKFEIKLNNLTFNNQQFSEMMKNGLNEIRQEIKGIFKECKSDFVHVRNLFFDSCNDIASLYEKIHQIETSEIKVLHDKIRQKETSILKELREGILLLTQRTE